MAAATGFLAEAAAAAETADAPVSQMAPADV